MKKILLLLLSAGMVFGQGKTPIYNGILQTDLNANHFKITLANLADYAGTNLTWNVVTNKFDATGGGGSGSPGGSNQQLQYNNSGSFGGIPSLTYDGAGIILSDGTNSFRMQIQTGLFTLQPKIGAGAWGPGLAFQQTAGTSAFTEYNGDISITAAMLFGLDDVQTGGDGGHPARTGMFNDSTTSVPGFTMTSNGYFGWADPAFTTHRNWIAENDTVIKRSGVAQAGVYGVSGTSPGGWRMASVPNLTANGFVTTTSGNGTLAVFSPTPTSTPTPTNTPTPTPSWTPLFSPTATPTPTVTPTPSLPPMVLMDSPLSPQKFSDMATATPSPAAYVPFIDGTNANKRVKVSDFPSSGAAVANVGSQKVTLSAQNGSATTAMRSDAAPPLDQSITPTMTGLWTWKFADVSAADIAILTLAHNTSSSGGGTGQGTSIAFAGANAASTNDIPFGRITALMNDGTSSGTTCLQFGNIQAGSAVNTRMQLSGFGGLDVGTATVSTMAAGVINAGVGYRIGNAAASGKILQGNGTNYVASTPTWPTASGTSGYDVKSDGTNFVSYPEALFNSNTAAQSSTFTADTYITNSNVTVAAGDWKQKGVYKCRFDMSKTGGTAAPVLTVRIGTGAATTDTAILTFTLGAGTNVSDTSVWDLTVNFRSVGSGTSAVVQGLLVVQHTAATGTGITSTADKSLTPFTLTTSSGFNSSTATQLGCSFNGGTSFGGTVQQVTAALVQP